MNRGSSAALALAALVMLPAVPALGKAQSTPAPRTTPQPQATAMPASTTRVQQQGLPPPPPIPVLPKVPPIAAGYDSPNLETPSANLVGVTQQPFVGITLQNAIGMALSHNPDLAISQTNRRIAAYQIAAAQGAYDVKFSVEPLFTHVTQAPSNAFFAGPNFGPIVQNSAGIQAGVSAQLANGQQYEVNVSGKRVNDNTTINAFDPTYPTMFSVNFTQPLLRGRGITSTTRAIALAKINADLTDAQTLTSASGTIAQVEDTYWDLVAAWRNVGIQEEALKEALAQSRSNQRLAKQGVNAPIEVVQSNTQVDVFQDNVFSALQAVATLQNTLKELTLSDPADPVWNANLVPTTPVLQLPAEPSLTVLVTQALKNRPEIAQIADARRNADVELTYAQNQLKPQVDLKLGYSSNGFAGIPTDPNASPFTQSSAQQVMAIDALITAVNRQLVASGQPPIPFLMPSNQPVPGYLVGNLDQSIRNLTSNKFPTYSAGVALTVPLGNRTAKADLAIAREREKSVQLQEASIVQRVTVDVRNALQIYKSAQYRLIAARSARQASQAVLASEQRRFRSGASTTFLVLQREVELADNRGRELRAQTDLNKAVVELERATGAILSANNVDPTTVGQGAINK
ncbi:MAG: TolC family protein [Candidatus Eremiobacteraeota bacterium]|nr:TolC family protein [Candidatus Eremiobacteraeota bacterium]